MGLSCGMSCVKIILMLFNILWAVSNINIQGLPRFKSVFLDYRYSFYCYWCFHVQPSHYFRHPNQHIVRPSNFNGCSGCTYIRCKPSWLLWGYERITLYDKHGENIYLSLCNMNKEML